MAQQQEPSGGRGTAGMQNTRTADVPTSSRTQTEPEIQTQTPILRLRGAPRNRGPRVQWAEGVVDNEGMGKKKSKVCCIYHRPKGVDESSDESSSDDSSSSSDDSDSDAGEGSSKRVNGDSTGKGCGHKHGRGRRRGGDGAKRERKPSPNAYEKQPKPKPRDGGAGGSGPIGSG
ncbi:Type 1 phosphatases regulator ypi-1 [Cytospora mali]|uniref:Type 1 phosphatases regulator n=1 Tax=Cytospora mali TaxID=578113 RepID=A0A194VT72_CYTMA|nr:Type 1 phosphatases regulator ypi-1 [Valsa mali]